MKKYTKYLVEIPTHEYQEKKVYYVIKVTNLETNDFKEVKKRYSELESIHYKILEWINIFKIRIPQLQFPKKKIFFLSTNLSEESVNKRRAELQKYFNDVFSHPELQSLGLIEDFIPVTKNRKPLDQSQISQIPNNQWSEIEALKKSYLAKHENQVFSLPIVKPQQQIKQQYTFKFGEHGFFDNSAIYTIEITDHYANKSWKFNQRYQDLKENHRQLRKIQNSFELPEFPHKKVISSMDNTDLKDRKTQLEVYLNSIFKHHDLVSSNLMIFFIAKSQLDGNEIGCRSKGPSQTTLENSSIISQSNILDQNDDFDPKQPRKITC
ncbi:unnamed protein product (macronuclear) [Paramecium tetraurelia]|uniref:PX domain-containing protein n=1 Tax=Paramecium tetraurelia TaxID=5888 RepID=A0E0Y3_PARTE|nr:uncharacterized protein GSPATT00022119001 [Paramecium tetraurelia]CAK88950.1 unnamed protein product [Paramecium tetraurelia]|eukprot:XP_001456347.1 hypothetical protein (macronuclear) [Paramecium tetraurelia strain d4-2]